MTFYPTFLSFKSSFIYQNPALVVSPSPKPDFQVMYPPSPPNHNGHKTKCPSRTERSSFTQSNIRTRGHLIPLQARSTLLLFILSTLVGAGVGGSVFTPLDQFRCQPPPSFPFSSGGIPASILLLNQFSDRRVSEAAIAGADLLQVSASNPPLNSKDGTYRGWSWRRVTGNVRPPSLP